MHGFKVGKAPSEQKKGMNMNDRILILRYSDFHGVDTIAAHQKVISESGHCWWAKIGKQPSERYLREFLEQKKKTVLLYTAGRLHKSELGSVLRERPKSNYPNYYERDIFDREDEPSVYFDLFSIEEIDLSWTIMLSVVVVKRHYTI